MSNKGCSCQMRIEDTVSTVSCMRNGSLNVYQIVSFLSLTMCGGCGPVHKPFAYQAGALRLFSGGDNAAPTNG